MKRMMFLGALVLGVTVCTQSFGFELLNRMLGHHGCASCCEPACDAGAACCEPACDAGNGCCEPACDAASCCGGRKCDLFGGVKGLFERCRAKHRGCCDSCCEPACDAGAACCEPACDAGNGCCEPACGAASCCGGRKHDLLGGLKGLMSRCRAKHSGCCEPACDAGAACCEPACDAGSACCEPACDAGNGCCEPSCGAAGCCGVRKCGTPIRDMLRAIHAAKKARHGCCGSCCEPGCGAEPACGCEPACGAVQEAVPAAPTPDASAATKTPAKQVVALK